MLMTWLFFLAALILGIVVVVYLRQNKQNTQAIRYEPELKSQHYKAEKKVKREEIFVNDSATKNLVTDNKEPIQKPRQPAILVLHILASKGLEYAGYELLQALLSNNLRFGKMNVFHRYAQIDNTSDILFSVASIKEPGTFEMSKMGGFSTPGLVFFLRLIKMHDPMYAFDAMLGTATQLVEDLGGTLLDDQLQPLTEDKILYFRSQIQQFLQKQQTPDLFG